MRRSTKTIITTLTCLLFMSVSMTSCREKAINDTDINSPETETTSSEVVETETTSFEALETEMPSAKELAQSLTDACRDLSSVKVTGTIDYTLDFGESLPKIGTKTEYVSDIVLEPYTLYMKSYYAIFDSEENGNAKDVSFESYIEEEGAELISYISNDEGETWFKFKQGASEFSKEIINSSVLLSVINEETNAEVSEDMESIGDQSCYVLSAEVPFSVVSEALGTFGNSEFPMELFDQMSEELKEGAPIRIRYWVDEKTFLPVRSTMDMSEVMGRMLSGILDQTESAENISIEAAHMISDAAYSDYNAVGNITIPDDARSARTITMDEYAAIVSGTNTEENDANVPEETTSGTDAESDSI